LLRAYATKFVPALDETALAALCAPGRNIASMRLLADLDALADTARASPRVARMLSGATDRDVLLRIGAMPEGAAFVAAFERFISTYGHRGVREIELAAPRWGEDPVSLLPLIRARLTVEDTSSPPAAAAASTGVSQRSQTPVRDIFTANRLHRAIVNALAKRARRFGALRENTRQFHVLALTTVRRKILALEQQLMLRGRLKCAGDIFFLEWDEISSLDAERLAWQDVEARVRARRIAHHARDSRLPPLTFNVPYAPRRSAVGELSGVCACAGEAIGTARIVFDPTGAEVTAGDVLVAPYTDPSWTPLFPLVSAIVVETGSYLSHAGTVARELGIPCLVDVDGCLKRIPNGARVHVRATDGIVAIVGDEVVP
jgi:pyruvate,water dikinase